SSTWRTWRSPSAGSRSSCCRCCGAGRSPKPPRDSLRGVRDPEVAAAVDDLERRGVLAAATAASLRRAATGDLISVREELRFLLWAGVALMAAGAGLLVQANLARIGPVTVAAALGAASAACLVWAWRRSAGFTWTEVPADHFSLDYVLLLG